MITINDIQETVTVAAYEAVDEMTRRAEAARDTAEWWEARAAAEPHHDSIEGACQHADFVMGVVWPGSLNQELQYFERVALRELVRAGYAPQIEAVWYGYPDAPDPGLLERRINAEMHELPAVDGQDLVD